MMFMLVSVYEREIYVTTYETKEEAYDAMMKDLKDLIDDDEWTRQNTFESEWYYDENSAWCNYNENSDWKIVKIEEVK